MNHPVIVSAWRAFLPLWISTLTLALATAQPASACVGSKPPQPLCGKTLALAKSVPGVVLNTGATTFNVPSLVFFQMTDFPPGTGICPAGPYSVNVQLTATCTSPPHGSGTLTTPLVPGFNTLNVPVTVGAGPQRSCSITGTATVTLSDGMTVTASGDQTACLVDPAPGNPAVPRLDMQLESGSTIERVAPGDQAEYVYQITNNDPVESFSGMLSIEMVNAARLPAASGPMPPGTGVFSVSDPGDADNFRLAFEGEDPGACLPLPPPHHAGQSLILQPVILQPGESTSVSFRSRPWGMCAHGSCGEGTAVVEGEFSDQTEGRACGGVVTAVDTSVPPSYLWPDAGQAATATAGDRSGSIKLGGEPTPGNHRVVGIEIVSLQLELNGDPPMHLPNLLGDIVDPERGRIQTSYDLIEGFDATGTIDLIVSFAIRSLSDGLEASTVTMSRIEEAPTGFEDVAPAGAGLVALRPSPAAVAEAFLELVLQVHMVAVSETGEHRDVRFQDIAMRHTGDGFELKLLGGEAEPGEGLVLFGLEVAHDFRGFYSSVAQTLAEIFFSDFETGDLSDWTLPGG